MTDPNTEALKPCPFCGGPARRSTNGTLASCAGPCVGGCSWHAVKDWNTRAPGIERDAEVAAMREALGNIAQLQSCDEPQHCLDKAVDIATAALASTAGTDLLERLAKAEGERDALRKKVGKLTESLTTRLETIHRLQERIAALEAKLTPDFLNKNTPVFIKNPTPETKP